MNDDAVWITLAFIWGLAACVGYDLWGALAYVVGIMVTETFRLWRR